MATYKIEIDERELEQQLRKIAKKRYESDKGKAISTLAKRAIRLEGKVDMERLEKLILHPAFGIWKDRKDMTDTHTWLKASRTKEAARRRTRNET